VIAVTRYRRDDSERMIAPSPLWFRNSCCAKSQAINGKAISKHDLNRIVHRNLEVRIALSNLFHDKCAYCECKLERQDMNVEHYRPKGGVGEVECHPGYYWLAYDWGNLLPSCTLCNQKRREIESLNVGRSFSRGGKGDSFPISDEEYRAFSACDDLSIEDPILVNPTIDKPSQHITFDPSGEAIHITERGEVSISTYHLNTRRIRGARKSLIKELLCMIKMRNDAQLMIPLVGSTAEGLVDGFDALIQRKISDSSPYAGLARAVVDRPELFEC